MSVFYICIIPTRHSTVLQTVSRGFRIGLSDQNWTIRSELDYQMINQVYQYPGPRLKQECLQGFDTMHFIIERDMLCLGTWCIPMGVIYQL